MSATKTQSSPTNSGFPGTTFVPDRGYYLRMIYERDHQFRMDCMQKEPSAQACDIANSFPPDLQGYMHGFSYWLNWCEYKLSMANPFPPNFLGYVHGFGRGKSLSARPGKVSSMDLLHVTARAGPLRKGGCTRMLQSVQECCAKPCYWMLIVAPLRLEVLRVLQKLKYKLLRKDYLQINAFPDLVVVEQEEYPHTL